MNKCTIGNHNLTGEQIRAAREELGMSRDALVTRLGVSQYNISHLEIGATEPKIPKIVKPAPCICRLKSMHACRIPGGRFSIF